VPWIAACGGRFGDPVHIMPTQEDHEIRDDCWCQPDIFHPILEDGQTDHLVCHNLSSPSPTSAGAGTPSAAPLVDTQSA
jgi:hypothetical protein